jgi:hypothetical protein
MSLLARSRQQRAVAQLGEDRPRVAPLPVPEAGRAGSDATATPVPTVAPTPTATPAPTATPTPTTTDNAGCTRPTGVQPISFSKTKYPNIRRHVQRALRKGWPSVLVLNRAGADARRDRLREAEEHRRRVHAASVRPWKVIGWMVMPSVGRAGRFSPLGLLVEAAAAFAEAAVDGGVGAVGEGGLSRGRGSRRPAPGGRGAGGV